MIRAQLCNSKHTKFYGYNNVTVYYLPGTVDWGTTFGERPTAPWFRPHPLMLEKSVSIQTNCFSFIISWATNASVVVEASTNPASAMWIPVCTNVLASGSSYFSDPQWASYPGRFYRIRSQ